MTLATTQDILATWPGWARLELDRLDQGYQTGNDTEVTELADPRWHLYAVSRRLRPNDLRAWRARLDSLDGGKKQFYGYDLASRYPIEYPNGSWPTGVTFNGLTAVLNTVTAGTTKLNLLPAAFQLRTGDLFSFPYNTGSLFLAEVVEDAIADGAGLTPVFEFRPRMRTSLLPGGTVAVSVKQPKCVMMIRPGSVSPNVGLDGAGTISFEGMQIFTAA